MKNGEAAWRWLTRGLAVIGFVVAVVYGLDRVPAPFFFLLIGLFFGPEVISGQLRLNRRDAPNESR